MYKIKDNVNNTEYIVDITDGKLEVKRVDKMNINGLETTFTTSSGIDIEKCEDDL